jgi:hypothetical protein
MDNIIYFILTVFSYKNDKKNMLVWSLHYKIINNNEALVWWGNFLVERSSLIAGFCTQTKRKDIYAPRKIVSRIKKRPGN